MTSNSPNKSADKIESVRKRMTSHYTNLILKTNSFIASKYDIWIKHETISYLDKVLRENNNIKTYAATLADLYIKSYMNDGEDIKTKKARYNEKDIRAINSLLLRVAMIDNTTELEDFFKVFDGICNVQFERGLVIFIICLYQTNKYMEILLEYDDTVACCRGHLAMIISFNEHKFDNVQTLLKYGSSDKYYYWHVLGNDAQKMLNQFSLQNVLDNPKMKCMLKRYNVVKPGQTLNIAHVIQLYVLTESEKKKTANKIVNGNIRLNVNIAVLLPTFRVLANFFKEIMSYAPNISHYEEHMDDEGFSNYFKITKVQEPYLSPFDREVD
jgi:hypothetical protein